jgi:2-iminobutanoate/2-iminopropanoate deaminase
MKKQAITTQEAPGAIGPYSQAVAVEAPRGGQLIFLSGQVALSPATGQLVGKSAVEQAEQVMQNLVAVLRAAECTFEHVVRTTIFLTDLGDFAAVNEVYGRYLPEGSARPARATVQVSALPRGALVEIDAIAVRA